MDTLTVKTDSIVATGARAVATKMIHLDLITNIYIFGIFQTTRKSRLVKPIYMHLLFNASQIILMVILVDLSA